MVVVTQSILERGSQNRYASQSDDEWRETGETQCCNPLPRLQKRDSLICN